MAIVSPNTSSTSRPRTDSRDDGANELRAVRGELEGKFSREGKSRRGISNILNDIWTILLGV